MSAIGKANDFIRHAQENGWKTKYRINQAEDFAEVTCTRNAEELIIGWTQNQLNEPPRYKLHGVEARLHSAAVARRHIQATKPDLDLYQRRARAAKAKQAGNGTPQPTSSSTSELEIALPFDPETDPDSVILKAIRGNVLIWRNSITNDLEREFVPHKVADGKKGVRVFNWDTENVFYLASSSTGRDYLTFMTVQGHFRSVALDAMVGVV